MNNCRTLIETINALTPGEVSTGHIAAQRTLLHGTVAAASTALAFYIDVVNSATRAVARQDAEREPTRMYSQRVRVSNRGIDMPSLSAGSTTETLFKRIASRDSRCDFNSTGCCATRPFFAARKIGTRTVLADTSSAGCAANRDSTGPLKQYAAQPISRQEPRQLRF